MLRVDLATNAAAGHLFCWPSIMGAFMVVSCALSGIRSRKSAAMRVNADGLVAITFVDGGRGVSGWLPFNNWLW